MNIISTVSLNSLDKIEKLIHDRKLLTLTGITIGIFYVIMGTIDSLPIAAFSFFVIGVSKAIRDPIFSHYKNQYIPSTERATIGSLTNMWFSLTVAIIYPLVGFLIDSLSLNGVLIMLGVAAIAFTWASKVEEKMLTCPI